MRVRRSAFLIVGTFLTRLALVQASEGYVEKAPEWMRRRGES